MAALRDLLEVYGALDEAAAKSGNPSVAATLDKFIPEASANTGWYREVENFFFGEKAQQSPNLTKACKRLGDRAEQAEQQEDARGLTAPQKQRLFYGLSAAARIHQVAPTPMLASSDSDLKAALVPALAAVGPEGKPYEDRRRDAEAGFDAYYESVQSGLTGRADYHSFRKVASDMDMVDPATLKVPLCQSAIVTVDGLRCAVIDTVLYSGDIPLNNLKAIVNPFNWNENYPEFFIRMAPFRDPFRSDRWRRVLETVGFNGLGGYEITTALKYYPDPTVSECEARLDYDLDDPTPGPGDGQVLVDRGYINMRVTNAARDPAKGGVRVRTRKVIHISGLSPFAQQRLVCLTGYGTASSEFLFGPASDLSKAKEDKEDPMPFDYYKHDQQPQAEPETNASEPSTHVVATAVNLWTDAVEGMASDYFDMAEKWMAGGLRLSDVTDFSQKVTGRLVSSPLEFLERVNQPRYPRGRPSQTQQGGAQ
jgi:hypothetical protein